MPSTTAHRPVRLVPYIAVAGLFVVCGAGFWNNILLFPKLAIFFGIDTAHARWIQSLYSVGYIAFAIPSALFHRKFGYKIGMIGALGLVSVGPFLVYPALSQHNAAFFLLAVVLLGAGWSALETSINALVVEMGAPETATRRLNFAQSFFPVGVVIGYILGRWFYPSDLHLSYDVLAEAAARPYVVVGLAVLLMAFLLERVEFPARSGIRKGGLAEGVAEIRNVLANPSIRIGAAAIFCCIALQSTLQGANYSYVVNEYPGADYIFGEDMVLAALIVFGAGRFAGTVLMGTIEANRLLRWAVGPWILFTLGALALGGKAGFFCLMATNLCMGIGYPTIFATTLRELRSETNVAAGFLVMSSGLAGLAIPIAMNVVVDAASARVALVMALPCFPVLYLYLRRALQRTAAA